MDPRLAAALRRGFRALGLRVERLDPALPEPWSRDAEFLAALEEVAPRTLVTPDRCYALWQLARLAAVHGGALAEVGVYRGGTARLLARACPGRPLHLFDTFRGMPHADAAIDRHRAGDFADTSLTAVRAFLADCPQAVLHPGVFPETAAVVADARFCLVHVDVDVEASVAAALAFFYPRVVPGGVLVFDDYDWVKTPGVRRALEAFLDGCPERPLVTARYQCTLVKVPGGVAR